MGVNGSLKAEQQDDPRPSKFLDEVLDELDELRWGMISSTFRYSFSCLRWNRVLRSLQALVFSLLPSYWDIASDVGWVCFVKFCQILHRKKIRSGLESPSWPYHAVDNIASPARLIISGEGKTWTKIASMQFFLFFSLTLLLVFLPGAQLYSFKSKWVKEKWKWRWRLACLFFPITLIIFKVGLPLKKIVSFIFIHFPSRPPSCWIQPQGWWGWTSG